ncbi:hypothetical protein N656DRAFT_802579 [Canariomyces notabilis]|uniref:Uncharacterized protein n=1 Tax=Canariomyces notabilis TaxID=2074819 RepID=A0AAN6QEW7_9PEZI|nr:hypothetical protein N656DRAFT_802579 [Canariomyces arenarius]
MSSSGKDFDQTSLASNAPLLQDKDTKAKDGGLLSKLRRSQKQGVTDGLNKSSAAAIEDLYKAYPNMGANTRLS